MTQPDSDLPIDMSLDQYWSIASAPGQFSRLASLAASKLLETWDTARDGTLTNENKTKMDRQVQIWRNLPVDWLTRNATTLVYSVLSRITGDSNSNDVTMKVNQDARAREKMAQICITIKDTKYEQMTAEMVQELREFKVEFPNVEQLD